MALSSEQIELLLKAIQQTRESEMSCPECLDELDKYTQSILDGAAVDGDHGRSPGHAAPADCGEDWKHHDFPLQAAARLPEETAERSGSSWLHN